MKKYLRMALAGLLALSSIVTMTGCGGKGSGLSAQKVAMGRYVETNLEFPKELEMITSVIAKEDGALEVYGAAEDKIAKYSQGSDGNWTKEEEAWLTKLSEDGHRINKVAYGADGVAYVLYSDIEFGLHLGKVNGGQTIEELPIQWGEGMSYDSSMAILDNGDVLIGRDSVGVTRFDGTSGEIKGQYDGLGSQFVVSGDKLMLIDAQNGNMVVDDLETGKELETISYEGLEWGSKLFAGQDGGLYLVNSQGISHLASGGSVWENLVEGNLSSFGTPSLFMTEAIMSKEEEFIVAFTDETEGAQLVKYTYDPNVASKPTTEVSIYMLEENGTIRQAISEYQRSHPEVIVNTQVGMSKDDGVTKADAIRTLNTELLAGKGPDLLLLDGLTVQSYIDKGVLKDMGEWAIPAIDQGEWLTNIMENYKKDGVVYALPTRFAMETMWGNKEIVNSVKSVEELASWAKQNPDKEVFYNQTPSQLIKSFYGSSARVWIGGDGQIKENELVEFLEAIQGLVSAGDGNEEDMMQMFKSIEFLAYKESELYMQSITGFDTIMFPYLAISQRGDGDFGVMSSGGGVFEPIGVMGINAKSEHQDIAKEIIQMALSEKVQDVELGDGFAVNTKSFEKGSVLSDEVSDMMIGIDGIRPLEGNSPNQETYDKLADYVREKLSVPATTDQILLEMLIEETKGYFNGEKTAQEAASAVANKTRAYLAE